MNDTTKQVVSLGQYVEPVSFAVSKRGTIVAPTLEFLVEITQPMHEDMKTKDQFNRGYHFFNGLMNVDNLPRGITNGQIRALHAAIAFFKDGTYKDLPRMLAEMSGVIEEYNRNFPRNQFTLPQKEQDPTRYIASTCGFATESMVDRLEERGLTEFPVYTARSTSKRNHITQTDLNPHEAGIISFPDFSLVASYADQQYWFIQPQRKLNFLVVPSNDESAVKKVLTAFYGFPEWNIAETRIRVNRRDVGINFGK